MSEQMYGLRIILKAAVLILNNHTRRRRLTQKTFTEIPCPRSTLLSLRRAKRCCAPELHLCCISRAALTGRQQIGDEHKQ